MDLEVGYGAEDHEGFLDVLRYIPIIEGIGLSLTRSLTTVARSITSYRDNSILGAFGSHFLCKFDRFIYSSAIVLTSLSVGDREGSSSSHACSCLSSLGVR